MRRNILLKIFLNFFLWFLIIILFVNKVSAATFNFEPTVNNLKTNEKSEVKININTKNEEIRAAEAVINYDINLIEIKEVIPEQTFFPTVTYEISQEGKLIIYGIIEDPGVTRSGSGTLAKIIIEPKNQGSTTLTFKCNLEDISSSKIIKADINSTNIIECENNNQLIVNIGENNSNNSNPQNNNNQYNNNNKTLPKSGIMNFFIKNIKLGLFFLGIGIIFKFF